jgi:hypothetical protein
MLPPYCGVRVGIVDAQVIHKRFGTYTASNPKGRGATYSWELAAKSAARGHQRLKDLGLGLKMGNASRSVCMATRIAHAKRL